LSPGTALIDNQLILDIMVLGDFGMSGNARQLSKTGIYHIMLRGNVSEEIYF